MLAAAALGLVLMHIPVGSALPITLAAGFALSGTRLLLAIIVTVSWMMKTLSCLPFQVHQMALLIMALQGKVITDCEVSQAVAGAGTAAGQDWQQSYALFCDISKAYACSSCAD